jgi:hypothetical protein
VFEVHKTLELGRYVFVVDVVYERDGSGSMQFAHGVPSVLHRIPSLALRTGPVP